eukprot:CAMPEP_0202482634 /NCGR_PEP_ID=MMETSP1361-20130828/2021_1 /ASSEMBLY_ACC=CAM_ASM_000849 /TAXON_ID=210615 /ORGANISM="Staurosira complex sp., Strain CCMP2646" /LENGTH=481 /DNA_ID=CAMNT_0049110591 /DNA_START=11 /DNA_END=1452 /DNA_ORIENTATION=+
MASPLFGSTSTTLVRVPRALSSLLKMSILMLVSTALFQKSAAICLGAETATVTNDPVNNAAAAASLLRGSMRNEHRQLFDPRAPFDFYNDACESECQGNNELSLFDNACPKCPESYESQHCNHCCYDGASSLRLRWHGCPGEVSFASISRGVQDCGLEPDDRAATDGIRFISCSCYETIQTPDTFDESACQPLSTTTTILASSVDVTGSIDSDICIVAVKELGGGAAVIDLSKPLPDVIGLVHTPLEENDEQYTSQYWNDYPLRTYFDTTCSIIDQDLAPYVLPLFPGYGKIPNSCPTVGFIDLWEDDTPRLPGDLDHSKGEPSTEPFWYEFIDGTSTGFWPKEGEEGGQVSFDPTFAVCACNECGPSTPTPSNPGAEPTGSPTTRAPIQPTASPVNVVPTNAPLKPTRSPVNVEPTESPVDPTSSPLNVPTASPTIDPNRTPGVFPTALPVAPTLSPVEDPTASPLEPTPSPVSPTASPV